MGSEVGRLGRVLEAVAIAAFSALFTGLAKRWVDNLDEDEEDEPKNKRKKKGTKT